MTGRADARDPEGAPVALTIAGSDSGGGAGIQADLKTFAALGVHGACAITAVTAQNTLGVRAIHAIPPDIVRAQIDAVLDDFRVAAVKIGMLADAGVVAAVADALAARASPAGAFVVCDPVLAASSGDALAAAGLVGALRERLLPRVACLTPNLPEAAALLGEAEASDEAGMIDQGRALLRFGPSAVLMKGGHLAGDEAVDLLVTADGVRRFAAPRIASPNTHGTGCTLASAIAAHVALGQPLAQGVAAAKAFVLEAIARGAAVRLGRGAGPLLQAPLVAPAASSGHTRGR